MDGRKATSETPTLCALYLPPDFPLVSTSKSFRINPFSAVNPYVGESIAMGYERLYGFSHNRSILVMDPCMSSMKTDRICQE